MIRAARRVEVAIHSSSFLRSPSKATEPQAQDEYDSDIGQVHGMLIRREPREQLVDFLWWVETEHMGLRGNRQHTESIADRLLAIADSLM